MPTVRVFTAPRERPIRRVDVAPREASPRFMGSARPGEFFVFQIGVYATEATGELGLVAGSLGAIPASAMQCLSLGGISEKGKPFTKKLRLKEGQTQVLWVGVDVPKAVSGRCAGTLTVTVGAERVPVDVVLDISGAPLDDHGDGVAANLSRLRWLNSTAGSEPRVTKPFTPVQVQGSQIRVLGRRLTVGESGLPTQIESAFNGSNTKLGRFTPLLTAPVRFDVDGVGPWTYRRRAIAQTATEARWSAEGTAHGLTQKLTGHLDCTGSGSLTITLMATEAVQVKDIALTVPLRPERAKLMLGLGKQGGTAPAHWEWKWDTKKHQDALWLGEVNAGLVLRFKGANFRRPLVNIYYGFQPLNLPESWGTGGVTVENGTVRAFTGPRTLTKGEALTFTVDFYLTPFKLLNTDSQWHDRYIHPGGFKSPEPHERAVAEMDATHGPNVLNVHQATFFSPYINYPYADASFAALQKLTQAAHAKKTKVKVYYTTREITQNMPELIPLHSLNGEVIFPGPGKRAKTLLHPNGPHPWLSENLGEDFIPAWQDRVGGPYAELDLSVITTPDSRWNNFYLEGLKWLCEKADIDGVYIDDAALDAHSLARARRILDTRPGRLIDFHTWNHFNEWAGFGHNLVIYQEFLPFLDRIWLGEGFPAGQASWDYWLTEMSGIPFGMMSEMLDGAHPWRGLLFGETVRLPWSGDPRPLWKAFDSYGIQGTELIGFWDPACPVTTDHPEIRATVYKAKGRTLIALGSWAKTDVTVSLKLDGRALGLDLRRATLYAARIPGFQSEALYTPTEKIPVRADRGLFLLLDETSRTVQNTLEVALVPLFADGFTAPSLDPAWKVHGEGVRPLANALRITAPANHAAGIERSLPPGVRAAEVLVERGTDQGQSWGAGLAFVFASGRALKVNCRRDGQFSVYDGSGERLAGRFVPSERVTLRLLLTDDDAFVQQKLASGAWEELLALPRGSALAGDPKLLRVGKVGSDASWRNFSTPDAPGECAIHRVAVFGLFINSKHLKGQNANYEY